MRVLPRSSLFWLRCGHFCFLGFFNGGFDPCEWIGLTSHTCCSITPSREDRCDLLSGNSTVASRVTTSETKKREAREDKRRSERIETEMAAMRPWLDVIKEEERTDGNVEEKRSVSFRIAPIRDALAPQQLLVKTWRAALPCMVAAPAAANRPQTASALIEGCVTAQIGHLR